MCKYMFIMCIYILYINVCVCIYIQTCIYTYIFGIQYLCILSHVSLSRKSKKEYHWQTWEHSHSRYGRNCRYQPGFPTLASKNAISKPSTSLFVAWHCSTNGPSYVKFGNIPSLQSKQFLYKESTLYIYSTICTNMNIL